jgi:hypothetical protein
VSREGFSLFAVLAVLAATAPMVIPLTSTAVVIPLCTGAVFIGSVVASVAYMALPITRLVCVEVVVRLFPARRHGSGITVMRVVAVVYVAIEAVMTVEPRAGADEYPVTVPIWPVISVDGTVVRSVVVISVGASRLNTDVDTDLSLSFESGCQQAHSNYH